MTCVLLILILFFLSHYKKEEFTVNDFYDKYLNTVSVPSDFYSSGNTLPEMQYAAEFHDRFFIDTLNDEMKNHVAIPYSSANEITEKDLIAKLKKRIDNYITTLLNKKLDSNESYVFNVVYSQFEDGLKWETENIYLVHSKHVLYRDTKVYGVSIHLTTVHDGNTGSIRLLNYKLDGYIFEDKISDYYPANLIDNNYQDYMKDKIITKDQKYENQYLCQYYHDVKKFRGLVVQDEKLDCSRFHN